MTSLVRVYELRDNDRIVIEVAVPKGDPRFKEASRALGAIYAVALSATHAYPYAEDYFDLCHMRAPGGSGKWLDMIVAPARFLGPVKQEIAELDAEYEGLPLDIPRAYVA